MKCCQQGAVDTSWWSSSEDSLYLHRHVVATSELLPHHPPQRLWMMKVPEHSSHRWDVNHSKCYASGCSQWNAEQEQIISSLFDKLEVFGWKRSWISNYSRFLDEWKNSWANLRKSEPNIWVLIPELIQLTNNWHGIDHSSNLVTESMDVWATNWSF